MNKESLSTYKPEYSVFCDFFNKTKDRAIINYIFP